MPVPICSTPPVPLMTLAKVNVSERSNATVPLSVILLLMSPVDRAISELQRTGRIHHHSAVETWVIAREDQRALVDVDGQRPGELLMSSEMVHVPRPIFNRLGKLETGR